MAILYNGAPADPNDPQVQALVRAGTYTNGANGDIILGGMSPQTSASTAPIAAPQAPGTSNTGAYNTDPNNQNYLMSPQIQYSTPTSVGPAQQQYNAQQNTNTAQQNVINARSGVIPTSQAQLDAERAANNAGTNVLNTTANTFPIQQAKIAADQNTLQAKAGYTAAQQGYIGQEQQANAATTGDTNAIIAARNNTQDQTNVAMYNEQQAGNSGIYQSEGLAAPQRVVTADNQGGVLAPGVMGAVQTQEQRVTQEAQDRATARQAQLQGANLALQLVGTNVTMAEDAAAKVGLTLQGAQLLVNQAQNQEGYAKIAATNAGYDTQQANLGVTQAGIGLSQAQLNQTEAGQPPAAGDVPIIDPNTGIQTGWGTPAEAEAAKIQYGQTQGLANAGNNAPIVDPNTGIQIGWGTPAQSNASKVAYSNNQQVANASGNAIANNQTQIASQAAVAAGRPLGMMTKGELIDFANTHPEYYFAVLQELQTHYGLDGNTANTLIQDALPRKATSTYSETTAPTATLPSGAAGGSSYQQAVDALNPQ